MKKLIFGNGKVGRTLKKNNDIILSRLECDITNLPNVLNAVNLYEPDVIVNCAAKTNLEYCEENRIEAFNANTAGVLHLLEASKANHIKLVHISSGCLFDGNEEERTEEDVPSPAVWYTWTKKWADDIIKTFDYSNVLVLRPRQLICSFAHPSNMITKFLSMESIGAIDEPNSLTCVEDLCNIINYLTIIDATGIYNTCNSGLITPYFIACKIRDTLKPSLKVKKVKYEDFLKTISNRRVNTILSIDKLNKTGYFPREATEALDWCLSIYK